MSLATHPPIYFVISELRWEVIVRFVNIRGIVDHNCLNIFLYIRLFVLRQLLIYYLNCKLGFCYKIFVLQEFKDAQI